MRAIFLRLIPSEQNNKMFFVEESNDAKNWLTVKTVLGAGNSNTLLNYNLTVSSNYSNGSYFRLTQVDYNGNSESFDPIFVNCENQLKNEISIFPNPTADVANLDIKVNEAMEIQLTLFSSAGQILFSQKSKLNVGDNLIKLDVSGLPTGMYHLNLINDKRVKFSGSRSIIKH